MYMYVSLIHVSLHSYVFLCMISFSVKELENFLSSEFMEKVALDDDAKADIVISGE